MNIFLSTSYSSKVLPDGTVESSYRATLEAIIKRLEDKGHEVFCALREDNWQLNNMDPGQAFLMDADAVNNSDLILVLIRNNPPSAGIQFELGVAYALKKRMIILWEDSDLPVPYINQGLISSSLVFSDSYSELSDVPQLLDKLLQE